MTSLDDFKQFVKDAEAGQQYAKWARDNPGDLDRWTRFKLAILAGQSPLPPVMTTDHGRELIDEGIETEHFRALEQSVTPPPPPPPPSGGRFGGNGLLSNEQSNYFPSFTTDENRKFALILSGSDKSSQFKAEGVKGVIYHTIFEVGLAQGSDVWPGAVTQADAAAKGWIYKTAAGTLVKDAPGYSYICDPSIPEYLAAWGANVAAQVAQGAVGVFVDNCAPLVWWGTRPYKNGVAVTDLQIADALMGFFTYLKTKYPSLYLLANIGAWDQLHADFAKRAAPVADGVMLEGYTATALQQATIKAIQAGGADPWVITPSGVIGSSTAASAYATAFASVYDRLGGGLALAKPEVVSANWTDPILA